MVVMAVAENESVDLARIHPLELHVGHQRFRRVAEVEQDRAGIVAALRVEPQRETPLGMERPSEIGRTPDFHHNAIHLLRAGEKCRKRRRRARAW